MLSRALLVFVVAVVAFTGGCSNSVPPISVNLSPSPAKAIDQGQTVGITATVANDSASRGVLWSLMGPGSLSATTGTIVNYTPPTGSLSAAQLATVTATSVADQSKSASLQITVNPFLQVPFQNLASGTVGTSYSQTIALGGGTGPFQWSVYNGPVETGWKVGGAVPDGLTLDVNTGVISGTPTSAGTWYFDAMVTDATGVTADNGFLSVQINPQAAAANPVPFLNQPLVPSAVSPGSAAFALNVSGAGFVPGAKINFNGAPVVTTFVDGGHLGAMIPAADVATAETASITVANPPPGGERSNVAHFQVGVPAAAVSFFNATNSPLQIPEAWQVIAADFNEDGKQDLAITGNVRLYVMLGNGDGTFAASSGSPVSIPSPPFDDFPSPYTGPAVALGDFNGAGHTGLAVGLLQNLAGAILFGNGDGTFHYADTLANTTSDPTMSLTAADFNADGNLDLVSVAGINGGSPVTLLGYGHGAFNQVAQNIQIYGQTAAAGDFNSDGKLDLTIDGKNILLGNGDGSFTLAPSLPATGPVVVSDFNGDGKLDLAVCNGVGNSVTILLGDGAGHFVPHLSGIPVGNDPMTIVAGDFNNDGKQDLAVANFSDNTLTLLLGNGDGTFTPATGSPYPTGKGPYQITAADFNGDGKLDLAVVNLTDGTVSILLQQ